MTIEELQGKKIGILGYGVEGKAVASFLHSKGLAFTVFDRNPDLKIKGAHYSGPDYLKNIDHCEVLFRSPGIKINESKIQEAQKKGTVITSQTKFFFENFKGKIIGITGTKGKSTTAKLIYDVLTKGGLKTFLAGNYGTPVFDLLNEVTEEDYVVLELSSFQLQDLESSPHIAVVLMITSEHLNYHKDTEEYVSAKSSITKHQSSKDFAVVNFDYESSRRIGEAGKATKLFVQTLPKEKISGDPFRVFEPKEYLKIQDGFFVEEAQGVSYLVEKGELRKFMDIKDQPLRGFHNQQNLGAAVVVAKILNVNEETIKSAVLEFQAPPHRLEFVGEAKGIKYYDDSISTTPESCLASVKAFTEPVVLILGGDDKKAEYEELVSSLCKITRLKGVVCVGEIGPRLVKQFKEQGFGGEIREGAKDMAKIVSQAQSIAKSGDVVLLAPATSSFGMFKDYKDRGEQFKKQALK